MPRWNWTRELQLYSVFVKETTRLRLFHKADSFPQHPRVCFSLCRSCDSCLSACCCCDWWNCHTLLLRVSSSPSPNVQFSQQFLHVLMSVELVLVVLVVRIPFWFWCLPFPVPLPFFRESAGIRSSSALVPFPADMVGFAPKFRAQ